MRRFYRYPLQALQNLRGADVDLARTALSVVEREIAANEADIQACCAGMRQLEQDVRQARSGGRFDLERQRASHAYLSHLGQRLAMLQEARGELLQREQDALHRLQAARSALRILEKHHARLGDAHVLRAERSGQRETDDSWLARTTARQEAP